MPNIQYTCPEFATFTRNIYRCEAELFLPGIKEIIISQEGTTQGGPESMGFYAVGLTPLTQPKTGILKVFYADDGTAGGNSKICIHTGMIFRKMDHYLAIFPMHQKLGS